jgi:diguanylate cyclase (GGDEF)-like protein
VSQPPTNDRIEQVVALLTQLASGDLSARGVPSAAEDDIDAVIVGINMLAEELAAGHDELEQRVRDRTAEYEALNSDILQLTELGNLLQACESAEEAYAVIAHLLAAMFDGLSGAIYLYRASRNALEARTAWGHLPGSGVLAPSDCWALRRGQVHLVDANEPLLSCPHVTERTGDSICIPMSAHGDTVGILHLMGHRLTTSDHTRRLTQAKRSLGVAVAEQIALAITNIELRERLRLQALRDPLTSLLNRRFVEEWIDREAARADRTGRPFGVIMADVDHFKAINDIHGHDSGDHMLKAVADAIRGALRAGDMPCRYGGEEFLILMTDVDAETLAARADLIRKRVAAIRIDHRGTPMPGITLSVGIALYPDHGATASDVVEAADAALYSAKRAGRDRTHTA